MRIWKRYKETVRTNWHLGITCFGGPAVQFQTFHKIFVEDLGWIDEPMYQQIFCLSQALPGSASVKMLLCINAIRNGLFAGILSFLMFSLPGAVGMYSLSVGISSIKSTLPHPAYALLSGLNAATVGVIALAAVKLASRAITDKVTRLLVYLGGILGMLYTALWYYPVLMLGAGLTTFIWDMEYLQKACKRLIAFGRSKAKQIKTRRHIPNDIERRSNPCAEKRYRPPLNTEKELPKLPIAYSKSSGKSTPETSIAPARNRSMILPIVRAEKLDQAEIPQMAWQVGSGILLAFSLSFVTFITLHLVVHGLHRSYEIFASLYLAGTIIFGGGPVVIPLLREYIVTPGWVSPRDFLLGIAVIQAFPGPNFNFVVYLGSLAATSAHFPSYLGALIAYVAMYTPGLFIVIGFMGLWRIMSEKKWFLATLRGINAAAVGLVFTAVHKLWQMGYLTASVQNGSPLGTDPWLVLITATAYVGGAWFGMSPPVAILLGGVLGILRYAVTASQQSS